MISFWKRAKIRRLYDSEPNVTHCAKECHVDPKSVRKYVDKNVAPATKKPREHPTRTAPLDEQLEKRNAKRREAIARERAVLAPLPPTLFPTFTQVELQVPTTSVIRLKQNSYSVPSYSRCHV